MAVTKTLHIGGEVAGYVTVDAPNHRFFVTRTTQHAGDRRGDGQGTAIFQPVRSHGVALVPKLGRGFITDGAGSGAIWYSIGTYQYWANRDKPDSDGIIYDPSTNLVLAVSGDGAP